jgi:hypothetical protein
MHFTPFFQFALLLVIPGALLILLTALFWTGKSWCCTPSRVRPQCPTRIATTREKIRLQRCNIFQI